jgi:hypothetical protein
MEPSTELTLITAAHATPRGKLEFFAAAFFKRGMNACSKIEKCTSPLF